MWLIPKTNWIDTDYFNAPDYERIKNNLELIHALALMMYNDFKLIDMPTLPYGINDISGAINTLESNINVIREHTYNYILPPTRRWDKSKLLPNYKDINRIESSVLSLYTSLLTQYNNLRRLPYRLGKGGRW